MYRCPGAHALLITRCRLWVEPVNVVYDAGLVVLRHCLVLGSSTIFPDGILTMIYEESYTYG